MRKSSLDWERKFCELAEQYDFHAERVASSGSRFNAVCDVVIVKAGAAYLVEVKSTSKQIFRINARVKQQLADLVDACESCGGIPILAVRFKRKEWKLLRLDTFKPVTMASLAATAQNTQFYSPSCYANQVSKGGIKLCVD